MDKERKLDGDEMQLFYSHCTATRESITQSEFGTEPTVFQVTRVSVDCGTI